MVAIPSPTIEPTIGVIDTLFDESVYFMIGLNTMGFGLRRYTKIQMIIIMGQQYLPLLLMSKIKSLVG